MMENTKTRQPVDALIVDDDVDLANAMRFALKLGGYTSHVALNGHEALQALESGFDPKVIFVDMSMPVMDGREFLRHPAVREQSESGVRLVVMSALVDLRDRLEGCEYDRMLFKPVPFHTLLAVVKEFGK